MAQYPRGDYHSGIICLLVRTKYFASSCACHVQAKTIVRHCNYKLQVVEVAEKKSKEAAARQFSVDPRRIRDNKRLPRISAGLQ